MAVTRIKNNQITDSTITYQKIATGTLTGALFNPDLTINSNISITGNLQVSGDTTTISSINTLVNDPLLILNNGYVGTPSYDVGLLINRALGSLGNYGGMNAALVWREGDGAFETVLTTETGGTLGAINRSFYANIITGNLEVKYGLKAGSASFDRINSTPIGDITPSTGAFTQLSATGNVTISGSNGNAVIATGNILPSANVTYNLGSTNLRWKDLWLSGSSIYIGSANIKVANDGNVTISTESGNNFTVSNQADNTTEFYGNAVSPWFIGRLDGLSSNTASLYSLQGSITTLSGNLITYPYLNSTNGNITTLRSGTVGATNLNATNGNIGTLIATSGFSSANAWVTGGFADNFPIGANIATTGKFTTVDITTGNIKTVDSYTTNATTLNATTGNITTGNIGTVNSVTATTVTLNVTTGNIGGTLTLTNSADSTLTSAASGALQITNGGAGIAANLYVGGNLYATAARFTSINNTPIGNVTPSSGVFTTLGATAPVYFSDTTAGSDTTANLGAVVIAGGLAVGGKAWFSSNVTIDGNLFVNGKTTQLGTQNLTVYDSMIDMHTFANLDPLT